jgi:hypothetical protein
MKNGNIYVVEVLIIDEEHLVGTKNIKVACAGKTNAEKLALMGAKENNVYKDLPGTEKTIYVVKNVECVDACIVD